MHSHSMNLRECNDAIFIVFREGRDFRVTFCSAVDAPASLRTSRAPDALPPPRICQRNHAKPHLLRLSWLFTTLS